MSEDFPMDDLLNTYGVHNPDEKIKAGYDASKGERWEHRIVREILNFHDLGNYASVLAEQGKAATGVRALNFGLFKQAFPSFPFWLTCQKIPYVWKLTMKDWVQRWTTTPLFKAYVKAEADAPVYHQRQRFGLVFEWLHVWPTCIMHNDYRQSEISETVIYRPLRHTDPPQLLVIQSFENFLHSLAWEPRESIGQ